ncbi:MAG: DHA1 family bicyclomycin/chloramphenicol resistance-like MFS transporter [Candidatus Midichloriaceae bacterium]|jgi:DHA1 family bicyclomycin/chloramphenicol resistance-like MFS transporter
MNNAIFSDSRKKFIFYMVVCAIGVFDLAIFFYLPLLSNVRRDFGISEAAVQFTAVINLLGLGVSSIIYGNLSDAWGRKKLIVFGILCFSIASFMISLTHSVTSLYFFRFLQGIGAGVSWSVGNAIVHDIYKGKQFEKAIIKLQILIGVVIVASPSIGAYVGANIGWRNSFVLISGLGAILLICSIFFLPETLEHQKSKLNIKKILSNYKVLLSNSSFVSYMVIKVLFVSVAFINVTTLPLIFIERFLTSIEFCGILMAFGGLGFVIGGMVNDKLINYFNSDQIIRYALIGVFFSSISLIIMEYTGYIDPIAIQAIKIPYLFAIAWIFGNATHKVVSSVPKLAGSASATMIMFEMLFSAFAVKLTSCFYDQTIYPMEIFTLIATLISFFFLSRAERFNIDNKK